MPEKVVNTECRTHMCGHDQRYHTSSLKKQHTDSISEVAETKMTAAIVIVEDAKEDTDAKEHISAVPLCPLK